MQQVVIGTAGHIDHGKTALVKALTGIDTDTTSQEKNRGITIDLGFAYLNEKITIVIARASKIHSKYGCRCFKYSFRIISCCSR